MVPSKVNRPNLGHFVQIPKPNLTAQGVYSNDEDTDDCVTCGGVYFDTDLWEWVGCDSCYRWYHFKCASFKRLPKKMEQFVCHIAMSNVLYAAYVKINTLNFGLCFFSNV